MRMLLFHQNGFIWTTFKLSTKVGKFVEGNTFFSNIGKTPGARILVQNEKNRPTKSQIANQYLIKIHFWFASNRAGTV